MRQHQLKGRWGRRRKPRTTDSRHSRPVPANERLQRPAPSGPDQVWVTDITAIRTTHGWLYLVAILDLWSRRIVGGACARAMAATLVLTSLGRALRDRPPPAGLLHHSDQGSQYVDKLYVRTLAAHGII